MSWLSGKQLRTKILRNGDEQTKAAFGGVYSVDRLPEAVTHRPLFLIVNTHTYNLAGEHWLVIFITKERRGEIFDSLALPASIMLRRWMNRFTSTWTQNSKQYQSSLSNTCGAFALFFILNRLKAKNLSHALSPFKTNYRDNEKLVRSFYACLK